MDRLIEYIWSETATCRDCWVFDVKNECCNRGNTVCDPAHFALEGAADYLRWGLEGNNKHLISMHHDMGEFMDELAFSLFEHPSAAHKIRERMIEEVALAVMRDGYCEKYMEAK